METADGFIVGVYHYCDRWCEYCPFTARCRVFVDLQEIDFEVSAGKPLEDVLDTQLARPVVERTLGLGSGDLDGRALAAALKADDDRVDAAYRPIEARAADYGARVWRWLEGQPLPAVHHPGTPEPLEVIEHFGIFVGAKVYRALSGLTVDPDDEYEDARGSAKAALIGIDRSREAWLALVEDGAVSHAQAAPFVADLVWLAEELERVLPRARLFVRPAFDEPDAVARLEAAER